MAHGRPRDSRKQQQWRQWLAEWQASGLSVQAFCARRGLAPARFYAWRRRLLQRPPDPIPFLPVQVLATPEPAHGAPLEIVLGGGQTVRVHPGFDAPTLRRLLAVLEEPPPC